MHYALIGYLTKDVVPNAPDGFLWGGTVTYAGRVVAHLDEQVSVVTRAEIDERIHQLEDRIQWHVQPADATSTFVNQYDPVTTKRHQRLLARAGDIDVSILTQLNPRPDIMHLAPLASEFDPIAVSDMFEGTDTWVVATPQGWMRMVDDNKDVIKIDWPDAEDVIPHLKSIVFSDEDVEGKQHLAEQYAALGTTVLYTRGHLGAILYHEGQEYYIKAAPTKVVDLTGAGDVIAAAFFIRYRETNDPLEAAIFGTAAASLSIESPGTTGLPSRDDILQRLAIWPEEDRLYP